MDRPGPSRTGTITGTSTSTGTTWIGGRGADRAGQGADRDGALTSGEEREVPGGGNPRPLTTRRG
ncbi:hypothetical protein D7I43_08770 [Micromonospora globbae]|uniref:Uncharacterized protein n=1 Tax=Micromonospora globbae TaxID=1894969 RepID=A0A420F4E1_9ACTN|nr:hypothetical protein D7I43_08770 [Micromonospora globbae]